MDKIIVLDFGSQYNQLIVKKIRSLHVYSELVSYDASLDIVSDPEVKGIIFSGGPKSVYDEETFRVDRRIYDLKKPILGICYGMQLLVQDFSGRVTPSKHREYGQKPLRILEDNLLFKSTPSEQNVWMSHSDYAKNLGENFRLLAESKDGIPAAICHREYPFYGLQFHPEVTHTDYGTEILSAFLDICHANRTWTMQDFIEMAVKNIKETVKDRKVLMGVSGGVDSSVAAVLIHKAIGDQLTCLFIDHGLLRKNEAKEVMDRFANEYKISVKMADMGDLFLSRLKNITDPEQKRKIIGHTFIEVFASESKKFGDFDFLGQGTLYTDIIESGTKTAQTIKSHHNVGGLPKDMPYTLLEPLNRLFKDEVRALGRALGIYEHFISRQPFPGPGLAIRILGEVTPNKIRIVQETDAILQEEIQKHGLNQSIWQYFTVLTDSFSVGVMGDQRNYSYVLAIRAVTSTDGMTADWAKIPYEVLEIISRRMVNEVEGINRIVYDITSKPPATIEWE